MIDCLTNQGTIPTATSEWPSPIPFAQQPLIPLPDSILPGEIGEYASALSASTETPPELACLMILGTISCAAGGKAAVEAEPGYLEPCHLFVCCALESGNRKTAVLSAATAPLSQWEKKQLELRGPEIQRLTSYRKSAEAVIDKLRRTLEEDPNWSAEAKKAEEKIAQLEADLPPIPVAPELWTSDSTPEKIECLLAQHGERFAVISDEGGIFDILGGRYSAKMNLDVFLKGHAGSPVRVHRTSREEVMLEHPALTMAIAPQPGVLRELHSNAAFRHRGMLARILYGLPPSNVGHRDLVPRAIPLEVAQAYSSAVANILDWQPEQRVTLTVSKEAYRKWKVFQRETEIDMRDGEKLSSIRDWGSKLPGAVLRVAGLLHVATEPNLSNLSPEIATPTMATALDLCTILTSHALAVFGLISEDDETRNAKRLLKWLLAQNAQQVSKREVHRAHQHIFTKVEQFNSALKTLENRKLIRLGNWSTPTKSGELIQINPALAEVI